MTATTKSVTLAAATAVLAGPAMAGGAYAPVDGHEVYYEVHGDLTSGGTPALLLHGGMMSITTTWSDIIPTLADERPVIAVDQQGHGRTGDREGAITLATMRADTVGVLDHLGVERAHVVGFSMGGMLGLELAVNAPERVASLTAISASQSNAGMLPDLVKMNEDPTYQADPEVAALLPSQEDFAMMAEGFAENPSGPGAFQAAMGKLNTLITSDWGWSDEEIAGIGAPVLLALGDNDFVIPEHALHMAETIPHASLVMLADTTHMTILMRPGLLPLVEAHIGAADSPDISQ
jgi:pimeloyl-ACP methyl ester carboxylesterase